MIRSVLAGGLILISGVSLTLGTEKSPGNAIVTASFRNGVRTSPEISSLDQNPMRQRGIDVL